MIAVVIPARLASTRLPRKALADIHGKPAIQWCYEGCLGSTYKPDVFVVTEDQELVDVVHGFGGKAILTGKAYNVLNRCSMAAVQLSEQGYDRIVVMQGDEPMARYEMIDLSLRNLQLATCLYKPIEEDPWSPNVVKLLVGLDQNIVYMSRLPVPGYSPERDYSFDATFYQQVGIMAFQTSMLVRYNKLEMGPIEKGEGIDLLRYMENGYHCIQAVESPYDTQCLDTQEDLDKIRGMLA
jgi:3-deoxy-manno-octulosonate cytidylyltransferase (CMP-KDO synthetase)